MWYFVRLYVWQYIDDRIQSYPWVIYRKLFVWRYIDDKIQFYLFSGISYSYIDGKIHVWYFLQQEAWQYSADSMNHFICVWYFLQQQVWQYEPLYLRFIYLTVVGLAVYC